MPEHFYLSLWLRDYEEAQMLERFRVLLETFPYSQSRPMVQSIRVYPLNWSEHPVLDEDFAPGAEPPQAVALASEFLHGDCAYESSAFWDLWVFQKNGGPAAWKKVACPVTLFCHGPDFEDGRGERGDLEVDFGLDTPFRADQRLPDSEARVMARDYRLRLQENMRQLLDFVQAVETRLPVQKRMLWTETGENFAQMVERTFQ